MKLSDRLKAAQAERFVRRDVAISQLGEADEPEHAQEDPFSLLKRRAQDALFARLGTRLTTRPCPRNSSARMSSKNLDASSKPRKFP